MIRGEELGKPRSTCNSLVAPQGKELLFSLINNSQFGLQQPTFVGPSRYLVNSAAGYLCAPIGEFQGSNEDPPDNVCLILP